MKSNNSSYLRALPLTLLFSTALFAEQGGGGPATHEIAAERILKLEDAAKQQVRHTMIGFTSTRIFYTFATQKVVMVIHIDNSTADFGTSGTLAVFAPDADDEGIAKWVNNAHSCGLFVDPAEPIAVHQLPKGISSVTQRERTGVEENPINQEPYADYKVRISIADHRVEGQFKIHAFEDDANVFLKEGTL
jgi:hypothetical protein